MSSRLVRVEFVVNGHSLGTIALPNSFNFTLKTLSKFIPHMESEFQGRTLTYALRARDSREIPLESDAQLCEAIVTHTLTNTQANSDGPSRDTLCFLVTATLPVTPAAAEEQKKPLIALTVEEVVRVFESLEVPFACIDLVRDHRISGRVLSVVENEYDLRDCGFTHHALDKAHAKALLQSLLEMQRNGVSTRYLLISEEHVGDIQSQIEITEEEKSENVLAQVRRLCTQAFENHIKSPLYLAARDRDFEGMQALLECNLGMVKNERVFVKDYVGALIKERSERLSEVLHYAVENGHTETVSLLLTHESNIGAMDEFKDALLHLASSKGQAEIVSFLLSQRANVETKNMHKFTSLHVAADKGHTEIVSLLLSHGASVKVIDENKTTPLHLAAAGGHAEIVSLLLAHNAKIEAKDKTGSTPLHVASSNGHTETVSLLLSRRANIEASTHYNDTPLHNAVENGHLEIVSLLLSHEANMESVNEEVCTPLHLAAGGGHSEIVSLLLTHNAEIEAINKDESTPLHMAAHSLKSETVSVLLAHNANIEAKEKKLRTPLHLAAEWGCSKIVSLLLEHGANLDESEIVTDVAHSDVNNAHKCTALHVAAQNGLSEVASCLLSNKASTEAKNEDERTPLHFAAARGHREIVSLLLEHNANAQAKNKKGKTPRSLATNEEIRILLKSTNK